ncbi:hypothetical protein P1J78_24625 [Psychromarinibacter sp. C21-152]|uniref:Uncharacterized protein n=1 Tax=Psychromarinibacter sediminicola TaxID=3033385 RepID=A0AAE3NT78_9RHOB|nr:hypothetical protein [Psychromarinibacter sediminicola]MDF0603903.1 hypothetical protein [Psychromarinibacter sediminicola]
MTEIDPLRFVLQSCFGRARRARRGIGLLFRATASPAPARQP